MVVLHFEPAAKKLPTSLNEIQNPKMKVKAFLTCQALSHPFQERILTLDQPVKIGRSMARARPSPNNAIFDCKVLSRNHALLWYENGKFFLQDTKSSNGTFVNNHRLSKGSEESPPREVFSGDVLQFGVTVIENSRKGKAIHDCIIATLKLILPDGNEAKASPSTAILPSLPSPGTMPTQDLYQLSQYIQEALHREQMLESKLGLLEKLVQNSKEASESGWKVLIDEDRLLTRLEILESQLQTYSKNFPDDKLREEISKLQEDKNTYQVTAKDSLMKILQEKLDVIKKLKDVERSLSNKESEYSHINEIYEKTKEELHDLATKYNKQLQEIQELTDKLQETEDRFTEENKKIENEKNLLQEKVSTLTKQGEFLQKEVESLQVDNDIAKQQLAATRDNLGLVNQKINNDKEKIIQLELLPPSNSQEEIEKQIEDKSIIISYKNNENESDRSTSTLKNHVGDEENGPNKNLQVEIEKLNKLLEETRDKKNHTEAEVIKFKGELEDITSSAKKHAEEIEHLQHLLQQGQQVVKEKTDTINELQDQLNKNETTMKQQLNLLKERLLEEQERVKEKQETVTNLQKQLLDIQQSNKRSHNEAEQLRNKVKILTEELEKIQGKAEKPLNENVQPNDYVKLKEDYTSLKNRLQNFEAEIRKTKNENSKLTADYKRVQDAYKQLQSLRNLKENESGLLNSEEVKDVPYEEDFAQEELLQVREELIQLKLQYTQCNDEKSKLKEILTKLDEDYQLLSYQTRTISACSIIPLILLALGIVFAFYPTLAKLTATVESPHPP